MTNAKTAEIVVCGAGIAGVSAAYQLAVVHRMKNVVIVDPLPPLTLTSDKSTECYRNWWPGPGDDMVRLMNRSIDIMEGLHREAPNRLPMNRRGYMYATATPAGVEAMIANAKEITALGAGDLRVYRKAGDDSQYVSVREHGLFDAPTGADLFLDQSLIRNYFPYVTEDALALIHTRRCGWFAAQQFGMYMFERAIASGVRHISGRVSGVGVEGGGVRSVAVESKEGSQVIATNRFVIAAGPMQKSVGRMIGLELPIVCEPHLKAMFSDHRRVMPRDMGLFIWNDPVTLMWSDEERAALAEDEGTRRLVEEFPAGVHGRPEGDGDVILLQWGYHAGALDEPAYPIQLDPQLPEIAIRGMARALPGMSKYFNQIPKPFIDGGYYARTPENRPLIGPLSVDGAYIIGGFGGFGMQVSCGAGDLLAKHMLDQELPSYAPAFLLSRYEDPKYQEALRQWGLSGQI
ncbi:MAG: FAD-dependent oxidoreductase [Chloroflexi bacterium]|nr:FAD-binding oxidoreductase [Chloroflexi bacterium CFX1]MCK6568005.1 FAD-binding oxidoreductase [Anaerolineales bacterium]MCQ3954704.1 FAD-dependent oxidoreductase [Chloroflexota bacterium]MDL1918405.1 FAD-binding oxidoreductase [Chloroflexi bacterium CFX5]NUQ57985.1 FAD-binding oxidoreductase [Anaerolineales bacterium]